MSAFAAVGRSDVKGYRTLKMISGFPEDYELLSFFEAEPTVLDADVPWIYNTLDFTTTRHGIEVHCRFVPSYGELWTRVYVYGVETASIHLHEVESMRLDLGRGDETLIATFQRSLRRDDFRLQLKPRVRIAWGALI